MLYFYDDIETRHLFAEYLKKKRKQGKFSREQLAEKSQVPASTIRRFETTGHISLKQFLALWLVLDDIGRLVELTKPQPQMPKTIDEVLRG
ncbi:XRE family transcriptional regulator [Bibersteinia trehalosi Y31]|uniref:XRE family transcriptional regulator n=1 Tax=Bibersteinia trehalosi Y31 TaxID=1261658 RepID=A0A179CXB6_BIBTR|nr:helix-turn-helix transcriptional regulator [Bibersteinia trehalosi]OAQ14549.1 XRE family transcriptional regulator [Bibersteinia trehalosi Y31]